MNNSLSFNEQLRVSKRLHIQQVAEGLEIFLGWESRNKYRILDENESPIAFAAEEKTGLSGHILRQFLGHWRSFKVAVFDQNKQKHLSLHFPFRWFLKSLYVSSPDGRRIGHLHQRFAFFRKKFDVFDSNGVLIASINSSWFKFWTFEFFSRERKLGTLQKKWSGALTEIFTDKDNFTLSFADPGLSEGTKSLMLATCLMVDIVYFENNQGSKSVAGLFD